MQGSASSGLLFPAGSGALLGCCGIERGGAAAIQTGVWVCTWTLTVSKGYSMSLQTKPATMPAPAASRVSAGGGQCSVAIEGKRPAVRCADHERKTYRQLSHFATFGQRSAPHPPTSSLLFPLSASSCPPVAPFSRSPSLPRYSLHVPPGSAKEAQRTQDFPTRGWGGRRRNALPFSAQLGCRQVRPDCVALSLPCRAVSQPIRHKGVIPRLSGIF